MPLALKCSGAAFWPCPHVRTLCDGLVSGGAAPPLLGERWGTKFSVRVPAEFVGGGGGGGGSTLLRTCGCGGVGNACCCWVCCSEAAEGFRDEDAVWS